MTNSTRPNLIIRPNKLGDLVVATPVFRAFKESFPDQPVHLLTDPVNGAILEHDPNLDKILHIPSWNDKRGESPSWRLLHSILHENGPYDKVAVLCPNENRWNWLLFLNRAKQVAQLGGTASAKLLGHRCVLRKFYSDGKGISELFLSVAAQLGATAQDRLPRLYVTEEERAAVLRRFPALGEPGAILVHAFCLTATANLSPQSYYQLCSYLADHSAYRIYILGTQREIEAAAFPSHPRISLELAGSLTMRELMAACTHVDAVLGGSSGIVHLAAALGAPTIGFYCPWANHHLSWGPRGKWVDILTSQPVQCRRMGATSGPCGAPGFCDLGFSFEPEKVLLEIEKIIQAKSSANA